jgi:cyanophycin synthetase
MSLETVPAEGQTVRLRQNSNLSTGGTATDVTDEVHPRNAYIAELAAQILALDVAGIDILCEDISRPLSEQGGAIVEVNAAPGLRMHLHPGQGQPRDVGAPIVEMLYPDNSPSRIPIIAVTGTNGKTTVTRLISHIYETAHRVVGMTCTDGTYINGELMMEGDCSGPKSAQAILLHPHVEVAVLETARGGILREGLAFDQCTVGVVTNVSSDHLGLGGVNTLDELAQVKQVVIEAVSRNGAAVLNADDPLVAEMAAATSGRVVYFSRNANNHIIKAHLADNCWGVFVEEGTIVLATGDSKVDLVELERIPFTAGGKIPFQVMNALAAVAAAWAAGVNPALIVRALTTFKTDTVAVPGRFNLLELNGVEVILDYGHNEAAMEALGDAIKALGPRRTVMAFTLPGDRRDEDIIASTKATIPYVDYYVIYDSEDLRGRAVNEVPLLIRKHLPEDTAFEFAYGQPHGMRRAWQRVRPGDRLIVIADEVGEALEVLHSLAESVSAEEAACSGPFTLDLSGSDVPEAVSSMVANGGRRGMR